MLASTPQDAPIPMSVTRESLVVSLQTTLDEDTIHRLRAAVLKRMFNATIRGVIIDLSGVPVLDSHEFALLRNLLLAVAAMGKRALLTGLSVGVVSSLMQLDVDTSGIHAVSNLDDGLELLAQPSLTTYPV